jgi:uncharacterized protein Smg (DUF494 family)
MTNDSLHHIRLVEILLILLNEIKQSGMEKERMEFLSHELMNRGYSEQEISTAFSWIIERLSTSAEVPTPNPKSFRVLHDIEKIFISKEAYGFLLQLISLGLLSQSDFERVVERALLEFQPNLGSESIKPIIAEVLFGENESYNFGSDTSIPDELIQ